MRLEYFEMVDSVDEFDAERGHLRITSRVPTESPVFEGHFPTYPILPGVMLLEIMNHASGYLHMARNGVTRLPLFTAVKKAKFRKFISPGTVLEATADLLHDGSGFGVTNAAIHFEGKSIAEAEITMTLVKFPTEELAAEVRRRAERAGLGHMASA